MVLESAFDDSPTSDYDPYASNTDAPSQTPQRPGNLHVDLSQASRPFPFMGPLLGFNNKHLVKLISGIASNAPPILKRSLTQDEIDGSVAAVSKYLQVHSWIYCNALIVGGFRAQATKPTMTWPGMNMKFFKNVNFSVNYDMFGPLRGPLARAGWNAVRTTTWMAWWGLPAYILGGLAGQLAMAQISASDPRLKQFHADMQNEGAKQRLEQSVQRRKSGLPSDNMSTQESQYGQSDDMSPQMETQTTLERGENVRSRGRDQYIRSSPKEPAPQSSTGERQMDDNSGYRYSSQDDASPFNAPEQSSLSSATGGSAWDRVRTQAGQRESAWDRVRRGGGSNGDQSSSSSWQSQSGGGNQPLTDSFTFDQRDEDRQLARSEAQKDFNARLDRERQGKDFNDTKGGRMW